MIVATTSDLPGMRVKEVKGMALGNTIRARNVGRDIWLGFATLWAGRSRSTLG